MDSAFEPRDPGYETRVRESYARQAAMATIGARLVDVQPGLVTIELPYRADLTQQHGFMHAGILATVMDSACGYAAFSLMDAHAGVLTVEYKVNLMAPAKGEFFLANSRVLRAGRTLTVCHGEAIAVDGERRVVVAAIQATIMALYDRADVRR